MGVTTIKNKLAYKLIVGVPAYTDQSPKDLPEENYTAQGNLHNANKIN